MMISRRALLVGLATTTATTAWAAENLITQETAFSPDWLWDHARTLAQQDYTPKPLIPDPWQNLSFEDFNKIQFDPQHGIWAQDDTPMTMDLFTAGLYAKRPATINIVEEGIAKTLGYDLSLFEIRGDLPDLPVNDAMGYSGFRLRTTVNTPDHLDEFVVFQGASYFRAVAKGQGYGISARGLALRTGDPNGEEFPDFTDFWVERAAPGETVFTVHALLDSPSTTGAYTFKISAGISTRIDVTATLFPRVELTHVGLGAMTSMFLFDETNRHRFNDFRPGVHDSDGLLIWNGTGEQIWRPLANPKQLEISAFTDENPRGFGLMQRTRDPENFADLQADYEKRPSLWITPEADWGAGAVELVEIPSDREIYDNTVAYWRPIAPLPAGSEYNFGYSMAWGDEAAGLPDLARVINTRIGNAFDQNDIIVAIDFADHAVFGEDLSEEDLSNIETVITTDVGVVSEGRLERSPGTGGVRLSFHLSPQDAARIELRAQLVKRDTPISEVWLYRWTA
ncbi:glucan biosynthesis protein [Octadecabacter sp. G9-8]|uniref:Glucan biosynthesis protein n=1 Tax=Octadecabacter dasysiphoniae TaxID=2909341 RepID=A0ABS9CTE8_9RHOB|nr:glucan biosynthesis protein [Octadecabacter dasysiphoniae]MCF2870433.1 glucan biosynthesis protein [Octadecabacter dasysiphoniae]